ncbi:MAG: YraN family protein [Verrucomicrobiota bacterium]
MEKATDEGGEKKLTTAEIGEEGEWVAAKFLYLRAGYKVLRKNYRAPKGGEVDLVCRNGDVLAFVEVKTRTSEDFGRPIDAVDDKKRRLIAKGALHWLRQLNHPNINFRFDVVEVLLVDGEKPRVNLVRGAFELPEPLLY